MHGVFGYATLPPAWSAFFKRSQRLLQLGRRVLRRDASSTAELQVCPVRVLGGTDNIYGKVGLLEVNMGCNEER